MSKAKRENSVQGGWINKLAIALLLAVASSPNASATAAATDTTCSFQTIETNAPINGLSFISPSPSGEQLFIAGAHGEKGTRIYTMLGKEVWRHPSRADVVSFYPNFLIVLRSIDDVNELEQFALEIGDGSLVATTVRQEKPSAIAATTLQRNAFASLGPVRIEDDKVLFGELAFPVAKKATAIAALGASDEGRFPDGLVAIGYEDGSIHILPRNKLGRCVTAAPTKVESTN